MVLTKLRDVKCDDINYKELTDKCAGISVDCSKQQADNVEEETRGQAQSKLWQRYRAGRVTASKAKAVSSTNKASPSQSLIKEICYPGEKCIQTNAMKWGCDHETDALQKFMEEIGPLHKNSRLQNSGFVISQDVPFIGASPDGIFICNCCGPAYVEVKCPFNARYEDINEDTVDCLQRRDGELELKPEHKYQYQVQTQHGVSKHEVGYFVVWTANDLHSEFRKIFPDQEANAAVACPSVFQDDFHYSVNGTCGQGIEHWESCQDTTRMTFNYTLCDTQIAYSNGSAKLDGSVRSILVSKQLHGNQTPIDVPSHEDGTTGLPVKK
ncbi:hypothetical protein MAR_024680 [Mya arenaria]|uniref:YqaJ viral recombinase domain-containing protein n=1 Tax=Mya arenaria TaxID=6604 RepID=A0ABY7DUF8_MYAAR|nr:hypothetical protein MAR_024680 [Mya arenaria]